MMVNDDSYLVGGYDIALKNMSSSNGMMTFPIYGKIQNVPSHQPDEFDDDWMML